MVDRQSCSACGGLGRLSTLDEPPEAPYSDEAAKAWTDCPRCKGTGVEMATREYEVYFRFTDEVDARSFMERAADDPAVNHHGIRAVDPGDSLADRIFPGR
ncbi:MAG TPA: hypothetical protein VF529_09735 [Solirubrobacteraceae bacterium]